MTSIETSDRKPSPELEKILNEANTRIEQAQKITESAKELVINAYNKALDEEYSPEEAKKLLFEKIPSLSQRTIYRYLPAEAKDQNMGRPKVSGDFDSVKLGGTNNDEKDDPNQPAVRELMDQLTAANQKIKSLEADKEDNGEKVELEYQLEEKDKEIEKLKKEKTIVENVKATGFVVDGISFPDEGKGPKFLIKHNASFHTLPGIVRDFLGNDLVAKKFHIWMQMI